MSVTRRLWWLILVGVLVGCQEQKPRGPAAVVGVSDAEGDAKAAEAFITENLATLSPTDRKLAEEQRFCPIMTNMRLGSAQMGPPVKLEIKGQTVFVCCTECQEKALKKPDATLAKAKELVAKNAAKPAGTAKKK